MKSKAVGWFSSESRYHQTRVSIESYHEYHDDYDTKYYLLFTGTIRELSRLSIPPYVTVVFPNQMNPWYVQNMHAIGINGGFLRTLLCDYMLQQKHERIMVFDGDTEFFGSLDDLWGRLEDFCDAIVTPHRTIPPPMDGNQFDQLTMVLWGNYNAGYVGFANKPKAREFINWWMVMSMLHQEIDPKNGFVAEQGWLRFICDYLDNVLVLRDMGVNFAYWRYDRDDMLEMKNCRWHVDGTPLRMFHFCRFDPENLRASMETHQSRAKCSPLMLDFLAQYRDKIQSSSNISQSISETSFSDGTSA